MPLDISIAYTVVDSLAKLITTEQAVSYLSTITWNSDTMKTIFKYMFSLHNYDFVRFKQYLYETKYNQSGNYKADLDEVFRYISYFYKKSNDTIMKKKYSILGSDAILFVHVVKVDSMKAIHASASRNADTLTYDFYQATFRILDTLKGNILPCSKPNANLKSEQTQSYSFPTMFAEFDYNTYWQDKDESHRKPMFEKIEPLYYDSSKTMFRIKPGDTAIVFIHNTDFQSDKYQDLFYLCFVNYYSNAALPVVNGMVKDINHIWFDQDFTPYQDWKNQFNSIKDSILLGGN